MRLCATVLLRLGNYEGILFDLVALVFKKLFKLTLSYCLDVDGVGQIAGVDRGVAIGLGWGLLETEAAGNAVAILLEYLADITVNDLVPAVHYTRLYQCLSVVLTGKEVLQMAVCQCLVLRPLLQR